MPRETFEQKLKQLQDEVLVLGSMVEKAIVRSIEALKNRDLEAAKQIVQEDRKINQKRYDIEAMCTQLLATQQPMARDLRVITSVLSIIADLERIGDHAEGISKITIMLGDEPPLKPLIDIPRMANKAIEMLRQSLRAFIEGDAKAAEQICLEDDEVDALYEQIYRELMFFMIQDPKTISRATYLLWVGHNLERIADRITNICERVGYMVNGTITEMYISKY